MKHFYTINPKRCRGRLYTRGGRFRMFPFSDARWSFTGASNYRALTGKNLVFWLVVAYGRWSLTGGGRTRSHRCKNKRLISKTTERATELWTENQALLLLLPANQFLFILTCLPIAYSKSVFRINFTVNSKCYKQGLNRKEGWRKEAGENVSQNESKVRNLLRFPGQSKLEVRQCLFVQLLHALITVATRQTFR